MRAEKIGDRNPLPQKNLMIKLTPMGLRNETQYVASVFYRHSTPLACKNVLYEQFLFMKYTIILHSQYNFKFAMFKTALKSVPERVF